MFKLVIESFQSSWLAALWSESTQTLRRASHRKEKHCQVLLPASNALQGDCFLTLALCVTNCHGVSTRAMFVIVLFLEMKATQKRGLLCFTCRCCRENMSLGFFLLWFFGRRFKSNLLQICKTDQL